GVKFLVHQQEAPDAPARLERGVAGADFLGDEGAHLGPGAEILERRIGEVAPLRPLAHGRKIDRDECGHAGTAVSERHGFADERAELELVLDELRGERRAVGERAYVLGAIDDREMSARIEKTRIAGAVPAVFGARLLGRVRLFVIAREQAARTD